MPSMAKYSDPRTVVWFIHYEEGAQMVRWLQKHGTTRTIHGLPGYSEVTKLINIFEEENRHRASAFNRAL
jgi:hypothetical protein